MFSLSKKLSGPFLVSGICISFTIFSLLLFSRFIFFFIFSLKFGFFFFWFLLFALILAMSLALDSASPVTEIRPPATGIPFLPNSTIFDSPAEGGDVNECSTSSTSSTSSIGKNSDLSGGGVSSEENYDDENEVKSSYKRALDSMDSLEEALPMRYEFQFICSWFVRF